MGSPTIVVPYVAGRLLDATRAVVDAAPVASRFFPLVVGDHGGYGRLMASLWGSDFDLVIVEHDVVPTVDQLTALAYCEHDWCGYGYDYDGRWAVRCLGCTRLSAALRHRWPTMGDELAWVADDRPCPTPWWSLDARLALMLTGHGVEWREHHPGVKHRVVAADITVS